MGQASRMGTAVPIRTAIIGVNEENFIKACPLHLGVVLVHALTAQL